MTDLSNYDVADQYLQDCRSAFRAFEKHPPCPLSEEIDLAQRVDQLLQWVRLTRDDLWDSIGERMGSKRAEIGGVVYERSKPPVSMTGFERERFLRDLMDATNRKTGEIESPYERVMRVARIDAKNIRVTVLREYGLDLKDYTSVEWSKLYKVRAVPGRVDAKP